MNIQEAGEEIIKTVRAYTARDEAGCFRISTVRQRPLLLMGPPGVGKTAVVEQAAEICGVGLVSYAMTHHTRQSAVGLPQLVHHQYGDKDCMVTEYTMSEIVASIYDYMEETGFREGILFLDEINCVSETLAPTMLQLLQFKMFGTHRVPEGWIIVAAGNPPEFNHAVRELDMAALDRVRTLEVEADVRVWQSYAAAKGVHPAVLSYLEMKPEQFYQVTETRKKKEFVTARGWEDLSAVLKEYERQGLPVGASFMAEFLRNPEVAADFDTYYRMDRKFCGRYRIPELLDGKLAETEEAELMQNLQREGKDAACMCVHHLLAAVSERMTSYGIRVRQQKRLQEVQSYRDRYLKEHGEGTLREYLEQRKKELRIRKEHGLLKNQEEQLEQWVDQQLLNGVEWNAEEQSFMESEKEAVLDAMNRGTDFLVRVYGTDLELADWLWGLKHHGDYRLFGFQRPECDHITEEKDLEQKLRDQLKEMEDLYETRNRI